MSESVELSFNGYDLIDNTVDKDTYAIRLNAGAYAGITYMYGSVNVYEKNGQGHMSFTHQILNPGKFNNKKLESDTNFTNAIGDILFEIMDTQLETGIAKIGHINTNPDAHS
jgi:hypothetical protein